MKQPQTTLPAITSCFWAFHLGRSPCIINRGSKIMVLCKETHQLSKIFKKLQKPLIYMQTVCEFFLKWQLYLADSDADSLKTTDKTFEFLVCEFSGFLSVFLREIFTQANFTMVTYVGYNKNQNQSITVVHTILKNIRTAQSYACSLKSMAYAQKSIHKLSGSVQVYQFLQPLQLLVNRSYDCLWYRISLHILQAEIYCKEML